MIPFKRMLDAFKKEQLRGEDNDFRFERELLMGELCQHLQGIGVNAILLEPDSPEAFRYPSYVLGHVKIEGRNIDAILVHYSISEGGDSDGGFQPGWQWTDPHYRYFYVVRANLESLESKLKADFKSNWYDRCSQKQNFKRIDETLMDRELSNCRWEGGKLAQLLLDDPELTQTLYNEGLDRLAIRPDRGHRCVRIEHWHWKSYMLDGEIHIRTGSVGRKQFPSRETFEAYEEVAYAIRSVILTSPQKSSSALKGPLILRCSKCAKELTIDAEFCPQCGRKLPHHPI